MSELGHAYEEQERRKKGKSIFETEQGYRKGSRGPGECAGSITGRKRKRFTSATLHPIPRGCTCCSFPPGSRFAQQQKLLWLPRGFAATEQAVDKGHGHLCSPAPGNGLICLSLEGNLPQCYLQYVRNRFYSTPKPSSAPSV